MKDYTWCRPKAPRILRTWNCMVSFMLPQLCNREAPSPRNIVKWIFLVGHVICLDVMKKSYPCLKSRPGSLVTLIAGKIKYFERIKRTFLHFLVIYYCFLLVYIFTKPTSCVGRGCLLHGQFSCPFSFRFSLSSVPFGKSGVFTRFMSVLICAQ
jgi:hypothetical protein